MSDGRRTGCIRRQTILSRNSYGLPSHHSIYTRLDAEKECIWCIATIWEFNGFTGSACGKPISFNQEIKGPAAKRMNATQTRKHLPSIGCSSRHKQKSTCGQEDGVEKQREKSLVHSGDLGIQWLYGKCLRHTCLDRSAKRNWNKHMTSAPAAMRTV